MYLKWIFNQGVNSKNQMFMVLNYEITKQQAICTEYTSLQLNLGI